MREVKLVESVLSLFVSTDEARAVAGDLRELSLTRGRRWHFTAVLRTCTTACVRSFAAAPGRMLATALAGLVLWLALQYILRFAVIGLLSSYPAFFGLSAGVREAFAGLQGIVSFVSPMYLAGWFVASRSGGRELPASVVFTLILCATSRVLGALGGANDRLVWLRALVVLIPFWFAVIRSRFRQIRVA